MIDYFLKGGFLMYPIAVCSIIGLAIIINRFIQYHQILKELEASEEEINKKTPLIMKPIIEGIKNGCNEKELSLIGTRQVKHLEKGLSWLSLIATIAPLLGLTGTVTGMIKAFMVIEHSTTVNPSMLAGGIWEALLTTAAGLLVAIPIHIGHHYLEKRLDEIVSMMREIAMNLYMRQRDGI